MEFYSIKEAYKKALIAFKKGEECYFCDFYNYPEKCDMAKDETCFPTLISRIFFSIRIFIYEYKHIRKFLKNIK